MSGHAGFKAIGPSLPPVAPQPVGPVGVMGNPQANQPDGQPPEPQGDVPTGNAAANTLRAAIDAQAVLSEALHNFANRSGITGNVFETVSKIGHAVRPPPERDRHAREVFFFVGWRRRLSRLPRTHVRQ